MDMDQAAVFLAGSVLTMMGFVVLVIGIVAVNNILHKYWKPVQFFKFPDYPDARFASDEELNRIAPVLDKSNNK